MSLTNTMKQTKRSEERDFLKKMDRMNQMSDFRNEFSRITMKDNMQEGNDQMIDYKHKQRSVNLTNVKNEKLNFFPFKGSDQVEASRLQIGDRIKKDYEHHL